MIYRRCGRCGARIESGTKCSCKREYGKPDGTRKLYHLSRWTRLRDTVMSMHNGLDPYALSHGRIEYATTVHHIIPAEEDESLFWDDTNLIPLSRGSHDEVHARYRSGEEEKHKAQEELRKLVKTAF